MTAVDPEVQPTNQDRQAAVSELFHVGATFDQFTSQMRRAYALNAHERLALSALWSRGPMTMTDLGTWIPLSRAAVTTLVDRLEAAGFVIRGSDAADRRRTVVKITDVALDRMRPVIAAWRDELRSMISARSDEEWATISSFLREYRMLNTDHATRLSELDDTTIQALARSNA